MSSQLDKWVLESERVKRKMKEEGGIKLRKSQREEEITREERRKNEMARDGAQEREREEEWQ